jgi:hypothetical protein
MGCCDSKPEPPEDMQMDHKPKKAFIPLEVEDEPFVPMKIEGDENEIIDFDFLSISTGKLELTTYPNADSDLLKKKTILYTGEHELGNGLYLVEIYRDEKGQIGIDATHKERGDERFLIENEK